MSQLPIISRTGAAICTAVTVVLCTSSGSQSTKFHTAAWMYWIFMSFNLEWCIWPDLTASVQKFCANLSKSVKETLAMIRQAFGEESVSITWMLEWKRSKSQRPKKARQVQSKVKSMIIIFSNIKGTVCKEFILEGQIVNFTYYCDILWWMCSNMQRLPPKLWQEKNWLLQNLTFPFSPGNSFYKKQHDCHPPTTLQTWLRHFWLFSVFPIEDTAILGQLGDRSRIAVGAKHLTEHNFQDSFKSNRSIGNGAYVW
jgi:hypothetical protein